MMNFTLATVAFLNGYMHKTAADPMEFQKWIQTANPVIHYNAIADAEHRGHTGNRFIRARHVPGGTSAYGPVQLNKQYLEDFIKGGRYEGWLDKLYDAQQGEPQASEMRKKKESMQRTIDNLHRQSKLFLRFGKNPGMKNYNAIYDYPDWNDSLKAGTRGVGALGNTPQQREAYKQTALAMMKHRVNKEFGGNWGKYLPAHRGKSRTQDPKYYKEYDNSLLRQYNEYKKKHAERQKLLEKNKPPLVAKK